MKLIYDNMQDYSVSNKYIFSNFLSRILSNENPKCEKYYIGAMFNTKNDISVETPKKLRNYYYKIKKVIVLGGMSFYLWKGYGGDEAVTLDTKECFCFCPEEKRDLVQLLKDLRNDIEKHKQNKKNLEQENEILETDFDLESK